MDFAPESQRGTRLEPYFYLARREGARSEADLIQASLGRLLWRLWLHI